MKQFLFSMVWTAIASSALFFVSCSESESPDDDVEKGLPEVQLEKVQEESESLSFTILVSNAEQAAYVLVKDGQPEPSPEEILQCGKGVSLNEEKTYVESDLEASTSYLYYF